MDRLRGHVAEELVPVALIPIRPFGACPACGDEGELYLTPQGRQCWRCMTAAAAAEGPLFNPFDD